MIITKKTKTKKNCNICNEHVSSLRNTNIFGVYLIKIISHFIPSISGLKKVYNYIIYGANIRI